jgi:CDP-diacylglycerol--serine O-phosphatidyltransferase
MGAIKRNIPNFITCLNLASGFIGIVFIIQGKPLMAVWFIFFAAVFDFFDGLIARLLKVTSPIGKDLDSLADVVTFGVLPGMMMYQLLIIPATPGFISGNGILILNRAENVGLLPYIAFIIPVFAAIRLAKFNNDTDQGYYFKGLPSPAAGLFIACYFNWAIIRLYNDNPAPAGDYFKNYHLISNHGSIILNPWLLLSLIVIISVLMVVNLKLMAFKFKGFGWKENQWKYILLILCLPLAIWLGFASAPIILILYIIISQIHFRTRHEIQS